MQSSSSSQQGWDFSPFDPGSTQHVEIEQQEKFAKFVQEYGAQLREIEEALDQSLSEVWDVDVDPISLDMRPYEQTTLLELIKTDNKLFNKIMIVFSSLSLELEKLSRFALNRFCPPILMFGQEKPYEEASEGDAQVQIGRMMPFLTELSRFVDRCYTVTRNFMRQLGSLYHSEQQIYQQSFKSIHLEFAWSAFGGFLSSLVLLDEVITQNDLFNQSWHMYKRMAKAIRADPLRYGVNEDQMLQFDKLMLSMEGKLFDGLIFQNCVEQEFDFPGIVSVRKNTVFRQEFLAYLKTQIGRMMDKTGSLADTRNPNPASARYMRLCSMYACYFAVFKSTAEKKLFAAIWSIHTEHPLHPLVGDIVWAPTDFLSKKKCHCCIL